MASCKQNCENIFTIPFWENAWKAVNSSFLADHQQLYPHRWHHFYETRGPWLRKISGLDQDQGCRIVETIRQEGLIFSGGSVIDLGCGSGWLALPMALKGASVLGVDTSERMLRSLLEQSRELNTGSLRIQQTCWTALEHPTPSDLAMAACFPPSLCPDGVFRMERLGNKCAFLLPYGGQGFPWVKQLWQSLHGSYPSSGTRQLQTAFNYLLAAGRSPSLLKIRTPLVIDLPLEDVTGFYRDYFSLFDLCSTDVDTVVQKEMAPFIHQGRVQARSESCFGLLWWESAYSGPI